MKPKKPTRKYRIVSFLADKDGWFTPKQISDAMKESASAIGTALREMVWDMRVRTDGEGRYARKHGDIVPNGNSAAIAREGESSSGVQSVNETNRRTK